MYSSYTVSAGVLKLKKMQLSLVSGDEFPFQIRFMIQILPLRLIQYIVYTSRAMPVISSESIKTLKRDTIYLTRRCGGMQSDWQSHSSS